VPMLLPFGRSKRALPAHVRTTVKQVS